MKLCLILVLFFCTFFKIEAGEPYLYLSSQEDVAERFIQKVREEKDRIFLASGRLSHAGIIEALVQAHQRNVHVEVIVDASFVSKTSCLQKLTKEGIAVWVWTQPELKKKGKRRMKHAFCVFGPDLAWTGSYSFGGKSTLPHLENALLLKEEKIAKEFLEEFENIKGKGAMYFPLHIQQK
jgi:phosphatidylserine/phosphatidylglycerophosphate/cardiolipin synthase-like enzyme